MYTNVSRLVFPASIMFCHSVTPLRRTLKDAVESRNHRLLRVLVHRVSWRLELGRAKHITARRVGTAY